MSNITPAQLHEIDVAANLCGINVCNDTMQHMQQVKAAHVRIVAQWPDKVGPDDARLTAALAAIGV